VKTRIGLALAHRTVGPIWPSCCKAVAAALWLPPRTIEAPPVATAVSPADHRKQHRRAEALEEMLFTSPGSPVIPEKSVAGEARSTVTPSGRIARVQMT